MSYRIHLLALAGISGEEMKSRILGCSPSFDVKHFADSQIFTANEHWSCLGVSTRSAICEHLPLLAADAASVWITTNDTDDWSVRIQNKSDVLVSLHLPLVNVDSDEHCESDGPEVLKSIAGSLPDKLTQQIAELDTSDAWAKYFDHASSAIAESLATAGIRFDPKKLDRLFSENDFRNVSKSVGAQLGYFVNDVLEISFDLSPADD